MYSVKGIRDILRHWESADSELRADLERAAALLDLRDRLVLAAYIRGEKLHQIGRLVDRLKGRRSRSPVSVGDYAVRRAVRHLTELLESGDAINFVYRHS